MDTAALVFSFGAFGVIIYVLFALMAHHTLRDIFDFTDGAATVCGAVWPLFFALLVAVLCAISCAFGYQLAYKFVVRISGGPRAR